MGWRNKTEIATTTTTTTKTLGEIPTGLLGMFCLRRGREAIRIVLAGCPSEKRSERRLSDTTTPETRVLSHRGDL